MRQPFLSSTLAVLIAGTGQPALLAQAAAAPQPAITYQGRLMESGVAVTGDRSFVFSIMDSGGTEHWTSGAQTLQVTGGLYSVVLGATGMPALPAAILAMPGLMLHVTISGQAMTPDVDIIPALQALSAWNLVGSFGGDLSGTQTQTLVMNLQGLPLDLTTTPPAVGQALVFNGTKWTASSVAGTGGPAGPQGAAGPAGPTGSQGPIGPAGAAGSQGALGPVGAAGSQGAQGPAGAAGAAGAMGPAGASGPQGLPGASPFALNGSNAVFTTGSVGVGTLVPAASALLDLSSTTQGFLAPSMSSAQRMAIAMPATGLTVYDSSLNDLYEFNGTAWVTPGSSSAGMAWLAPVNGLAAAAPASPSAGDRYLATASWGISPANSANQIGTYSGSAWSFATPALETAVFAAAPGNGYVFNGVAWTPFTATLAQMGAAPAQVLTWNGSAWTPANPAATGVTSVTASAPLASSGGSTPNLTLGTVPVGSGGTGATTLTGYVQGSGTGAMTASSTIPYTAISGLGSAAMLNAGTGANGLVQLNGSAQLPAVDGSLLTNLPGVGSDGLNNTRGGVYALGASPTGNVNTAFGARALFPDTTGSANSAFGASALQSNQAGQSNTAVGYYSLAANTNAGLNIAIGPWALAAQSYDNGGTAYSSLNVAIGYNSLASNNPTSSLNGMNNIGLGINSLYFNTTGSNNIAIGPGAGYNLTTGNDNIDLGNQGVAAESGAMRLGTAGHQTTTYIAGIAGVTLSGGTQTVVVNGSGQLGAVASSSGTVSSITAATPLTGGTITGTGSIGITQAGTGSAGYLSASDWNTFNNKGAGTVTAVTASAPLVSSGGATPAISLGTVPIANGGTGATTAANALAALGIINGNNTSLGMSALAAETTGSFNTAVGGFAMAADTVGGFNTAFGTRAMGAVVNGYSNIAIGFSALGSSVSSDDNVAVGMEALYSQSWTTGAEYNSGNVAVGSYSLYSNNPVSTSTGVYNTAVGDGALYANTTGAYNIGIGSSGGNALTTGNFNIDIGHSGNAGEAGTVRIGTPGNQTRTFIAGITGVTPGGGGAQAVVVDVNGQLGSMAISAGGVASVTATSPLVSSGGSAPNLTLNTVPVASGGTGTTTLTGYVQGNGTGAMTASATIPATAVSGLGSASLLNAGIAASSVVQLNSSAQLPAVDGSLLTKVKIGSDSSGSTAAGASALPLCPGFYNAAFGSSALGANTTGYYNTAVGAQALAGNTSSFGNVAVGYQALNTSTGAGPYGNTAVGAMALVADTTGTANVALGYLTLEGITSGSNNLALGFTAGTALTTESNNIDIQNNGTPGDSGVIRIGSVGLQTQTFIQGIRGVTTGQNNAIAVMIDSSGQLGTISSSIRFKEDVQDMGGLSSRIYGLRPVTFRYKVNPAGVHVGLIAEEVEQVMPELVVRGNDGRIETVAYQDLAPMLLNELQKEHLKSQELQAENAELKARLARIEKALGL
jgi:hypothetical protein